MRSVERRKKQRGVALLMVMIALIILGAMTADLMDTTQVYVSTTANARDSVRAEYLARSGVSLSRLLLSFGRLLGQQINFPFWEYADMAIEMFTDKEGGMISDLAGLDLSGAEGLGLGDGDLEVKIIDEDSKLNVNVAADMGSGNRRERMILQLASMMAPEAYDPLFERNDEGQSFNLREEILCEIIDWTDPDEDLCDNSGSEDRSIYQALDPSYERKNAPFDSLEELHFVKGVNDDFWSAFVDPDPEDPERRVMTVWGKGRINVNTAPPQVLYPIVCMLATDKSSGVSPCLDPMQNMNVLMVLQGMATIRTIMPFSKVGDFLAALENPAERLFMLDVPGVPIARENLREAKRMLTTKSTVFSIYAKGTVGNVAKRLHVVVDMEGQDMIDPTKSVAASGGSVLYWRMD